MSSPVASIFRQAARQNRNDACREGNLLRLTGPGRVIVAGDLHGNRQNYQRIASYAKLGQPDAPRLILQEIIHGPVDPVEGVDRSVEVMLRAARLKLEHPDKVYFLMGNHDLAQFSGNEISKEGRGVCKDFIRGVEYCFEGDSEEILDAIYEFCRSLPLAARFDNRVQVHHSLPSPPRYPQAGLEIFGRAIREEDGLRGGALYDWIWGRNQTPQQIEQMAADMDVEFFVLGHRHIQEGFMLIPPRAVAINCNGPQGCIVEFPADKPFPVKHPDWAIRSLSSLVSRC